MTDQEQTMLDCAKNREAHLRECFASGKPKDGALYSFQGGFLIDAEGVRQMLAASVALQAENAALVESKRGLEDRHSRIMIALKWIKGAVAPGYKRQAGKMITKALKENQ